MAESLMARLETLEALVWDDNQRQVLVNELRTLIREHRASARIICRFLADRSDDYKERITDALNWLERNGVKR